MVSQMAYITVLNYTIEAVSRLYLLKSVRIGLTDSKMKNLPVVICRDDSS